MATRDPLDDISKRIIEQLQENGRRSYAEIGKAVGLSEAAVRQRVQRLTDAGIMQVVAVTDPLRLGFHRQALVGLRVSGDTRAVAAELERLEKQKEETDPYRAAFEQAQALRNPEGGDPVNEE